jgi:hypothetical protein
MARPIQLFLIIAFVLLPNPYTVYSQKLYYVGIPNSRMNYFASVQEKTQWCWAASIQMVMHYYNVNVDQQLIVERTYGGKANGDLPDLAANIETINRNLNHKGIDKDGKRYIINAQAGLGAPEPALLVSELSQKRPVIIGYKAGFGGHIVLVTAVSYYESPNGPIIRSIVVRDPLPEVNNPYQNGRIEYDAMTLASRIEAYWLVRVLSGGN